MLYLRQEIDKNSILAIWKMTENRDELLAQFNDAMDLSSILSISSDKRILEKLTTLLLLKEVVGEIPQIAYFESGKPYLNGQQGKISISHTKGYVAVIYHRFQEVGIDIEQISDKIRRVRSRVVSDFEYISEDKELIHLLLHWSAKETMFKVIDSDGIDFLTDLFIQPFTPQEKGIFVAQEKKTAKREVFDMYYMTTPEFVLTYTISKE